MQYKIGATALFCALCSLPAAAQPSVTLYGVVDAGIEFANHQTGGDHSVIRMTSGNVAGSRWGLRGRRPGRRPERGVRAGERL
jgi:predicted porin